MKGGLKVRIMCGHIASIVCIPGIAAIVSILLLSRAI